MSSTGNQTLLNFADHIETGSPRRHKRCGTTSSRGSRGSQKPRSVADVRSTEHWAADGDLIVRVGSVLYRLDRAPLVKHSKYFERGMLFAPADDGGEPERQPRMEVERIEGCQVYAAPPGVTPMDFEVLLRLLKDDPTLLKFLDVPPSHSECISLTHAGHALSARLVSRIAEKRLKALWGAPRAPYYTKTSPHRPPSSLPTHPEDTPRPYTDALAILRLPPRHSGALQKRALYELLAAPAFWAAYAADRAQLGLPSARLLDLADARHALQRLWRAALAVSPREGADRRSVCHPVGRAGIAPEWCRQAEYGRGRGIAWRSMLAEGGDVEKGEGDPMRYDLVGGLGERARERWCRWCLGEFEDRLADERMKWWGMMDEWFKLN
ncbi:hypothetical protein C8Q78DRAFT_1077592 [Trametes maxima]|nr:hypothetical protein C8Q78DRAFT_1077592 [Trametes maxima]